MKAVLIALMLLSVGVVAVAAAPTASACLIPDDPVDCVRRPVNFVLDFVDCRVFNNC